MKKLTDQELDSLFRNAAEGYEPSFDAADWEAMNAKLDQPKAAGWKRWMTFTLTGLIIFFSGVWVGTYLNEDPSLLQEPSELKNKELVQEKDLSVQKEQEAINQISEEEGIINENNKVETSTGSKLKGVVNTNNYDDKKSNPIVATENNNPISGTEFISIDESNSSEGEKVIVVDRMDLIEMDEKVKTDTAQSKLEEEKNQKPSTHPRGVFLRVLASPDFSSINYSTATSTGSNYALLLDYQFNNRWSVSTGGIWSMKKYSSEKETTYGSHTANQVDGACRILDIPVNVYYHFRPEFKTSFYAGVGLSSYIMLTEDYTYTVNSAYGNRTYDTQVEGENNEWFKVLNLSLGIQYAVAPRLFIQAEPFLKAPLDGLGERDVLLSSMGIFIGLKYKISY